MADNVEEVGRAAIAEPALVPSGPEPASGLRPTGDDPARERVRVILDCEWGDLQHALDMVIEARPDFDRSCRGPGWGWSFSRRGKPSVFVRRTKRGYSALDVSDT